MKVKIILENLLEDLRDLTDIKFKASIEKLREEYRRGEVFTHEQVFSDLKKKHRNSSYPPQTRKL